MNGGREKAEKAVFRGVGAFSKLTAWALRESWRALPIGERVARAGLALAGARYGEDALEPAGRPEICRVSLLEFDCATFVETALALARMLGSRRPPYEPRQLLAEVEAIRYRRTRRRGRLLRHRCAEEGFHENVRRGVIEDVGARLGGAHLFSREERGKEFPFFMSRYVPTASVKAVEPRLAPGDIVAVLAADERSGEIFCSHAGLCCRGPGGAVHFLHASEESKAVRLDGRLFAYLRRVPRARGISVARPLEER